MTKNGKINKMYTDLYPNSTYLACTRPDAPKYLRLAFHDCIPYKNPEDGTVNGCDGCLNTKGEYLNQKMAVF